MDMLHGMRKILSTRGSLDPQIMEHIASLLPLVPRREWSRLPAPDLPRMATPLARVVVSHTDDKPCMNPEECEAAVRRIQARDIASGLPDIQHNFLVGDDGHVYEGRGWTTKPDFPVGTEHAEEFQGSSLHIGLIQLHGVRRLQVCEKFMSNVVYAGLIFAFLADDVRAYQLLDGSFSPITDRPMLDSLPGPFGQGRNEYPSARPPTSTAIS